MLADFFFFFSAKADIRQLPSINKKPITLFNEVVQAGHPIGRHCIAPSETMNEIGQQIFYYICKGNIWCVLMTVIVIHTNAI